MIPRWRRLGGPIPPSVLSEVPVKSTNPVIWSHEHSSLVTPKESRTFPGVHTSMDVISKGASGSKLPSHVDFSEDATFASRQCAHDRVHFLTSPEMPGHQNRDTALQWVLYTPVCPAVGDAWHAENASLRNAFGTALVLNCMQRLKFFSSK